VSSAVPVDVKEVQKSGIAYDSFKFVHSDGHEEWVSLFDYHRLYEKSIDRIVTLGDFDVIHAHDWLTMRAAMRAKQLSGKPLIVHMHATEADRSGGNGGNPMVEEIEYMGLMMADKIIAVSELTKQVIIKNYRIPAEKIEVVHNSIDTSMYDDVVGANVYPYLQKMRDHGYKVVMNFGRITVQKGLHNLIYAMQKVVEKRPKSLLVFMGSGEQELELLELAAEVGLSGNVLFTGFQRGKNWRDIFAVSDMFVMPSVSEPFGLTALEAATFGVSTLVSHQSGVAEVMQSILKVNFWDVDEMANQICTVLDNQDLQDQLAADGLEEVARMTWRHAADKLLNVYERQKVLA
jgi:glycogen(starch) synthase